MFVDRSIGPISAVACALFAVGASAQSQDTHTFSVIAQLTPAQETLLSAELATRITDLPLKEGHAFQQGDLLVGLDCDISKSKLSAAKADALKARKSLETIKRLQKFNSKTKTEVEIAEAELMKADANVSAEKSYTSKCTINAPFDGKVADVKVDNFQFVRVGDPLIKIIDDTRLGVEFLAPSIWAKTLKVGSSFEVNVVEADQRYRAEVLALGAAIDPVSHSFKVIGHLVERPSELMVGMTGRIILPAAGE